MIDSNKAIRSDLTQGILKFLNSDSSISEEDVDAKIIYAALEKEADANYSRIRASYLEKTGQEPESNMTLMDVEVAEFARTHNLV